MVRALPKSVEHGSVAAVIVRGLAELSGSRLEDLPASRDEVLAIAQIAGPDAELLLGQKATESAFKYQALADYRVIHLATHAAADPQYPDRAALVLGIAPNTSDDGLLQVREIMRLSLNAELVTLSACDTNVGAAAGEAGVVNLEQAFLIAGARAVVASLWNVEDNSTTVMMKAFYTHLAEHEDKALALAHAKRDVLERYGDVSPYYWAPFVMVGEGSQPVSFGR
jgi:CHAT domain-containing protein